MVKFTVTLAALKAFSLLSAKQDVRYYLTGVMVNKGKLFTTDGHKLIYGTIPNLDADFKLIIPMDLVKVLTFKAKTALPKKAQDLAEVEFTIDSENKVFTATINNSIVEHFTPIDGTPVDVDRVIVQDEQTGSLDKVRINWEYMATFSKAAQLLGCGKNEDCTLNFGKTTNAAIRVEIPHLQYNYFDKIEGVIMPMRF